MLTHVGVFAVDFSRIDTGKTVCFLVSGGLSAGRLFCGTCRRGEEICERGMCQLVVLLQVLAELLQAGLQHLGIAEGAIAHTDGLGHIEVVAGDHQDLLGGHGILGQGLGVHVVIIVDQAGGAHGLGTQVQVGLGGHPVLHDLAVGLQNGTGAGPQGLVMLQRDGGDDLVPDAAADGVVGTAGLHDLVHLVVAADDPADTGA